MEYLAVDSAVKVVELMSIKPEYIPGFGARCPLCGSWGELNNRNVKKLKNGKQKRYYICSMCHYKFVSCEK